MKAKPNKILVVAITRFGDLLQATPVYIGMKKENPDCKISMITEKDMVNFCKTLPCIDEVIELDLAFLLKTLKQEGEYIVDAYNYIDQFVRDLRAENYEMVVNISSSSYSALLIKMLNVRDCRGWVSDGEGHRLINSPWSRLFSANVYNSNRDFNSINIVDFLRSVAGVIKHPLHLLYEVSEEDRKSGLSKLDGLSLTGKGPLICLQAGASQPKRQWSLQNFAILIKHLVEDLDARIVLTGSLSESLIIKQIMALYQSPNIGTLAGITNFGELGAVFELSSLTITGDTGPMHMSVAVGTPVVAIFLASALCYETAPYSAGNIVVQSLIDCCPCNPNYPCSRTDCHEQISPTLVYFLAKKRLEIGKKDLSELDLFKLEIPSDLINTEQTSVLVTYFDSDNFLAYKPLVKGGKRNTYPNELYEMMRACYRQIWKEEFGVVQKTAQKDENLNIPLMRSEVLLEMSVNQSIQLCNNGLSLLSRLMNLIEDETAPSYLLGEINEALAENDRLIENIGLEDPFINTIIRLFIIEKENMRGEDPAILSKEMEDLYRSVIRRITRLNELVTIGLTRGIN